MNRFSDDPNFQAFRFLQLAFVVGALVAGIDKFLFVLANWSQYLSPLAMRLIATHDRVFMGVVGGVEIVLAFGVLIRPHIFGYLIAIWLALSTIDLMIGHHYYDVALRQIGLIFAAVALAKLGRKYKN